MTVGESVVLGTGPSAANQGSGSNITLSGGPITMGNLLGGVQIGKGFTLSNGGSINVTAGSYLATAPQGGIDLRVINSLPGIIGTGGNVTLNVSGGLTTAPGGRDSTPGRQFERRANPDGWKYHRERSAAP